MLKLKTEEQSACLSILPALLKTRDGSVGDDDVIHPGVVENRYRRFKSGKFRAIIQSGGEDR